MESCSESLTSPPPLTSFESSTDDESIFLERLKSAREGSQQAVGEILSPILDYLKLVAETELAARSLQYPRPSDMVQLAQLEALQSFSLFRGNSFPQFRGWIKKILLNNITDAQRAAIREQVPLAKLDPAIWGSMLEAVGENSVDDPSPSSLVARDERDVQIQGILKALPPRYQEVITRHHFMGESFESMANRWNCSEEAVRKVWTRALVKMREKLGPVP